MMIFENGEITSVSYDARLDEYYANVVSIKDDVISLNWYPVEKDIAEIIERNLQHQESIMLKDIL